MQKIIVIVIAVSALLFASFTVRADEPQANEEKPGGKAAVFARIEKTVADVKTVASEFRQERRLAMLKDPIISGGCFAYEKPDKLRWEFIHPDPSGFLVNGTQARQWKGKDGPGEAFAIKQSPVIRLIVDQIMAWTKADFPWIEQRYIITVSKEDPVVLKLAPISSREKKYIDHIVVSFEAARQYVNAVDIIEKDGDSTHIGFFNMTVNGVLEKGLFE